MIPKVKVKKQAAKTPAKEPKTPKTPRGKARKEEDESAEKKAEELVSRSGRKIRPKRYMDEHTEENSTLPSPAPKKRRATSPAAEKDKVKADIVINNFNAVTQMELEDIKEPFSSVDSDKENILISYLPSGQYVGIKLFQSRPSSFKNEAARLLWDRQAATNAITLKHQLERGHISAQSITGQLVMDLGLTDEEKATLDKERDTEEKKSRVRFLKTEMKLIELDTKIKSCLCLEKADTTLCLKLLDEFEELDLKPLMLLKHPSCVETVKRMRAYVGNAPSWDLTESDVMEFNKHAHQIRKMADSLYTSMRKLFTLPQGLKFYEYFCERVALFKSATEKLSSDELLELVHEPIEMSQPSSHTMKSSVDAANGCTDLNKSKPSGKQKKPAHIAKQTAKRDSSKKSQQEEKEAVKVVDKESQKSAEIEKAQKEQDKAEETEQDKSGGVEENPKESEPDVDSEEQKETAVEENKDENLEKNSEEAESEKVNEKTETKEVKTTQVTKDDEDTDKADSEVSDKVKETDKPEEKNSKNNTDKSKDTDKPSAQEKTNSEDVSKDSQEKAKNHVENSKDPTPEKSKGSGDKPKDTKDTPAKKDSDNTKDRKDSEKRGEKRRLSGESNSKSDEDKGKDSEKEIDEPRSKRSREVKKTDSGAQRSPTKRKSKA
ncbi:unnamed protein product [Leptidea sinapis]|uniref:Lens epithelium-derived growth factor integrase-binding domain-containing protein n=1 Tax=Leptidea sinapis TaxID=189913 RepID=A0A5E4R3L9_9NEOP|nr:unnamed protein product [Leptidea sinapis]